MKIPAFFCNIAADNFFVGKKLVLTLGMPTLYNIYP
jgi:hypothetical protein